MPLRTGHIAHPYRPDLDLEISVQNHPLRWWPTGTPVLLKLLSVWWTTLWIWHLSSPSFAFCVRGRCTSWMRLHAHVQLSRGVSLSNLEKCPRFHFWKICAQYLADFRLIVVISNLRDVWNVHNSPLKLHVVLNSVAVETGNFCSDSGDMLTKSGINIISYLKWI